MTLLPFLLRVLLLSLRGALGLVSMRPATSSEPFSPLLRLPSHDMQNPIEGFAPLVTSISGVAQFYEMIESIRLGELIVPIFFAPWCRASKGTESEFKRMAIQIGDSQQQQHPTICFMQPDWEENHLFCKTIGVSALPLVKMPTSEGEIEINSREPKKVALLKVKLDEWTVKLVVNVPCGGGKVSNQQFQLRRHSMASARGTGAVRMTATPATTLGIPPKMAGGITINKPPSKDVAPPEGKTNTRSGGGAKFRVLLFNDPVNTKEYVARVLMTKSGLTEDSAFQCMMQAHKMGMGLVGIWLRERAEAIASELQDAGLSVTMAPDE